MAMPTTYRKSLQFAVELIEIYNMYITGFGGVHV